jgi:hypothetical protein
MLQNPTPRIKFPFSIDGKEKFRRNSGAIMRNFDAASAENGNFRPERGFCYIL